MIQGSREYYKWYRDQVKDRLLVNETRLKKVNHRLSNIITVLTENSQWVLTNTNTSISLIY